MTRTDFERKVLYARIGDELRIARRDMPHAGDYEHAVPWAGLRPATPDGAPILGPSPVPGLWFNLGHGGLGFTFACGSASILARLMSGLHSPLPLEGFTWPAH